MSLIIEDLLPYQQRVLEEKDDLDSKISKLTTYTESEGFRKLDYGNQLLLYKQLLIMYKYRVVLIDRILLF